MLRPEDEYPGRTGAAGTDYPDGSFRDESTPGMNDGTPLQQDWANDREGFRQGIVRTVGSTPNGVVDTAVQSQAIEAVLSNALGHTRPRGMGPASLCSGLHLAENAFNPNRAPHFLDGIHIINDACIAWDYTKDRPLLMTIDVSDSLKAVECWDYSVSPYQGTAYSLTLGGTIDSLHAIACDGPYLYLAWLESSGNLQVSKLSMETWTGIPIWTADTGYDGTFANEAERTQLVIGNSSYLGILFGSSGDNTNWKVGSIAISDGTIAIGTGNSTSDVLLNNMQFKLTSNGTAIFWSGYSIAATDMYLCSAGLPTVTASPYSLKTRVQSSLIVGVQAIDPDTIVMSTSVGGTYSTDLTFFAYIISDDTVGVYANMVQPAPNTAPANDYESIIGFDGQNVWALHNVLDQATAIQGAVLRSVSASRFGCNMDTAVTSDIPAPFVGIGDVYSIGTWSGPQGKLIFDGRDMWLYFNDSGGGNIFRVQSPGIRGV